MPTFKTTPGDGPTIIETKIFRSVSLKDVWDNLPEGIREKITPEDLAAMTEVELILWRKALLIEYHNRLEADAAVLMLHHEAFVEQQHKDAFTKSLDDRRLQSLKAQNDRLVEEMNAIRTKVESAIPTGDASTFDGPDAFKPEVTD